MRYTIKLDVDTTRANVDRIIADLELALTLRLPLESFKHLTLTTPESDEQIGDESV